MAAFPDVGLTEANLSFETQIYSDNTSVNWRHQVVVGSLKRAIIDITTAPLTREQDREMQAFFNEIGSRGIFDFNINNTLQGEYLGPHAAPDSLARVNGSHSVGATIINVSMTTGTATQGIPPYSYIRFGHDKIYQVLAISGSQITIAPGLSNTLFGGPLYLQDRIGRFRIENGAPSATVRSTYFTTYSMRLIEEL